jgi:hypothetical protein
LRKFCRVDGRDCDQIDAIAIVRGANFLVRRIRLEKLNAGRIGPALQRTPHSGPHVAPGLIFDGNESSELESETMIGFRSQR